MRHPSDLGGYPTFLSLWLPPCRVSPRIEDDNASEENVGSIHAGRGAFLGGAPVKQVTWIWCPELSLPVWNP